MTHRADVEIDAPSRSAFLTTIGGPRHKATYDHARKQAFILEEWSYFNWCRDKGLDPWDTSSMVAYEGEVGYFYLNEPAEDHR